MFTLVVNVLGIVIIVTVALILIAALALLTLELINDYKKGKK